MGQPKLKCCGWSSSLQPCVRWWRSCRRTGRWPAVWEAPPTSATAASFCKAISGTEVAFILHIFHNVSEAEHIQIVPIASADAILSTLWAPQHWAGPSVSVSVLMGDLWLRHRRRLQRRGWRTLSSQTVRTAEQPGLLRLLPPGKQR